MLAQFALVVIVGRVAPLHGVQQEAAGAAGGVHDVLLLRRVEHTHAHLNDMARGEELAFFLLGLGGEQVFEGVIHDAQVGAHETNSGNWPYTDLQMALG